MASQKTGETQATAAERWCPEEYSSVKGTGPDGRQRTKAMETAITALETEVLDVVRAALPRFGLQGDALVDAGLLVRTAEAGATPLRLVLPALEAEVLSATGASVRLRARKLDGEAAQDWADAQNARESPDSGHYTHELSEKQGNDWQGVTYFEFV